MDGRSRDDDTLVVAGDHLRALGVALDQRIGGVLDPDALRVALPRSNAPVRSVPIRLSNHERWLGRRLHRRSGLPRRLPEITLPGPIVFCGE